MDMSIHVSIFVTSIIPLFVLFQSDQNEGNLKNEDDHQNEDDLKNKNNLKNDPKHKDKLTSTSKVV